MRALSATCALFAVLAIPVLAQAPARFLKIDITSKNGVGCCKSEAGPTEVHVRVPLALARSVVAMAMEGHGKINGKDRSKVNVEQLLKLVESAKPGDLLMDVTTNTGDLVKIAVE